MPHEITDERTTEMYESMSIWFFTSGLTEYEPKKLTDNGVIR